MQIALKRKRHFCATPLVQLLRAMRLIAFIMLIACLQASATGYSQKITLDLREVPLGKVFKEIRRQSGYFFLYNNEQVNKAEKVSLKVDKASLEEALEKCLSSTPFTFRIIDRTIVLNPKPKPTEQNISEIPVFQKITGTLLSSDKKEPLQGATISVKGTTIMTITDSKGSFIINAEPGSTLVISYVGYETREIKVGSETTLNLELKVNAGRMQELIVSYGTQRQREVTGSITQLKAEETKDMPVGQFAQKLQGKFAGVQVSQTTGRPGQGMAFRIRGAASINSNNVPLFVVDGQPLTGRLKLGHGSHEDAGSRWNVIGPGNDILPSPTRGEGRMPNLNLESRAEQLRGKVSIQVQPGHLGLDPVGVVGDLQDGVAKLADPHPVSDEGSRHHEHRRSQHVAD